MSQSDCKKVEDEPGEIKTEERGFFAEFSGRAVLPCQRPGAGTQVGEGERCRADVGCVGREEKEGHAHPFLLGGEGSVQMT